MSTRESLDVLCDTPDCTYTIGYFRSHSEALRKTNRDGWYRDAWTDRCPECVAKLVGTQRAKTEESDITHRNTDGTEGRMASLNTPTASGELLATPQDNPFDNPEKHCLNVQCIESETDSKVIEVENGERRMAGCICAGGTLAGGDIGGDCCVLDRSEIGGNDEETNRGG